MPPLTGARALVTGPTSGIGTEIALQLAAMGAHVVLGCRDEARGRTMTARIEAQGGAASVLSVDVASQASIRSFARLCGDRYARLDILVNNAGTSQGDRRLSVDGLELTFATNVIGYWLLANELREVFASSAPARIVNVASMFAGDLDLDDLQFERRPYDGLAAYAQSKACNRLLTWALARRLRGTGVTANAYAPGFVAGTGLPRDLPPQIREAYRTRPGRTLAQGADTAVWLATGDDVAGVSGRFFMDRREIPCELRNEADEERLWEICEGLVST